MYTGLIDYTRIILFYINKTNVFHSLKHHLPARRCFLSPVNESAIFDQEAKIVFMDIRFACRHLCVCVWWAMWLNGVFALADYIWITQSVALDDPTW